MPGSGPIDPDIILFNFDGSDYRVAATPDSLARLADGRVVKVHDGVGTVVETPLAEKV